MPFLFGDWRFGACITRSSSAVTTLSCNTSSKLPTEEVGVALVSETFGFGAFGDGSLVGIWLTEALYNRTKGRARSRGARARTVEESIVVQW
jgi:hypothetical protein